MPTTPRSMLFLVGVLTACGDEPVELLTEPLVVSSEPPLVQIDLDDDQLWVTPGEISGLAVDPEQAASTVPLVLTSNIDGSLWRGNPDGDGSWSWQGDLSVGVHSLQVEAVDREGNRVLDSVRVAVRTNAVPRCRILEPTDGARVRRGDQIRFRGEGVDDDGDPLLYLWRSSLDGPLFEGTTFQLRLVSTGAHRISVEVADGIGSPCVSEVTVFAE